MIMRILRTERGAKALELGLVTSLTGIAALIAVASLGLG
ncbi:Flp pilus assembly pilin Flp [Sphingobium sp. B2D3A]|nr:Flp pilus assembly pilin Flp [Sphingobium sp. B2D3A]MCW2386798.1 Flp pilus assembly pilin Flp [Sphingobium sp. B2D3D]MCW2395497.1 Flp pilus assembly pilin Flp [Sphingobium sp. B8D3B]MCW2400561.1 Flp pilus assembly pilin Flp [Sphingobium sp. B10D7B]MCW2407540.1 Flp pilus assembly pilin Flp [Sphingobium xanthum]MCW2413095.1 Flp pilus assembly pilin Flp [Sphingobium sp. B8D3D]MCW2414607.1 Flp pilus assembly pilin Flp [Sphingobium sp. B8D3A]MCW2419012.1 Flp pilus assembly pilin Flp [Sphingobi